MPRRQSSQPATTGPRIDMAALGERLWRFRAQRGWSQKTLADRAGVDPMVLSRLEQRQKPRLEIETAARLAHVCGWTLDQLCGFTPVSWRRQAPTSRWYSPVGELRPAWLDAGLPTTTEEKRLAALLVAWQERGARMPHIVQTLNQWGFGPLRRPGARWGALQVRQTIAQWTFGQKKQREELLAWGKGL